MEYEIVSLGQSQSSPVLPKEKPEPKVTTETKGSWGRDIARTVARGTESVVGLPGDIAGAALGLGSYLSGGKIPTYDQVQEKMPISLPTSEQVRTGVTKKLTGEYLEPKNESEKFYDEVVGDLASFMIPIKGKIPFKGAILRAVGGNTASWLTKEVGGGEGWQAGAKLGFNLLAGLPGGRSKLSTKMEESYKTAEALGKGAKHTAKSLQEETNKIMKFADSGIETPVKKFLKGPISNIQDHIAKGNISVDNAWQLKRDVNSLIGDMATPRAAKPYLKKLTNNLNDVLKDYGKKNPEFYKNFSEAEDIYKGLNQASSVNRFLQKNVNIEDTLKNPLVKGLFLGGVFMHGGVPGEIAAIGSAYTAREGVKALEFLKNSKQARTFYANTVKASLAGNTATASRNLSKLDKLAEEKYPSGQEENEYEITKV